jgi:hypothetical protein
MGKPRGVIFKNKDEENSNSRSNSRIRQSKPEQYSEVVGGNIRVGENGRVGGKVGGTSPMGCSGKRTRSKAFSNGLGYRLEWATADSRCGCHR